MKPLKQIYVILDDAADDIFFKDEAELFENTDGEDTEVAIYQLVKTGTVKSEKKIVGRFVECNSFRKILRIHAEASVELRERQLQHESFDGT